MIKGILPEFIMYKDHNTTNDKIENLVAVDQPAPIKRVPKSPSGHKFIYRRSTKTKGEVFDVFISIRGDTFNKAGFKLLDDAIKIRNQMLRKMSKRHYEMMLLTET